MKHSNKLSGIFALLLLTLFSSCKEANDNNESTVATEQVEIENVKEVEQLLVEPTDDSSGEYFEEEPVIQKNKRQEELELLKKFRKSQNKNFTDENGLVQTYTADKVYGEEIILGSTEEIKQIEEEVEQWHGYKLIISLREVTNNLKINGELKYQIRTFEQLFVVEHRYWRRYNTGIDNGTGANLAFEPETEPVDNRKKIFAEIHRRFAFRYDEPDKEWKQAYANLIKSSGVLEINSTEDYLSYVNQKKVSSPKNDLAQDLNDDNNTEGTVLEDI